LGKDCRCIENSLSKISHAAKKCSDYFKKFNFALQCVRKKTFFLSIHPKEVFNITGTDGGNARDGCPNEGTIRLWLEISQLARDLRKEEL
jgi:hypothetical protein